MTQESPRVDILERVRASAKSYRVLIPDERIQNLSDMRDTLLALSLKIESTAHLHKHASLASVDQIAAALDARAEEVNKKKQAARKDDSARLISERLKVLKEAFDTSANKVSGDTCTPLQQLAKMAEGYIALDKRL